jgi:alpha-D-xyloside xylohydrolase
MRGGHDAVVEETGRLREEGLGASAIWLDSHYEPKSNSGIWGSGTYATGEYPDISQTVKELNALGLRAMTYVNPFLYKNTPAFEEAVAKGYAVKDANGEVMLMDGLHATEGDDMSILEATGLHSMNNGVAIVDFTNPDARAWWQGLLRVILLEEGFDGWMEDFGESVPVGALLHDGTSEVESHNRYPVLYHSAAGEEIERSKPDAVNFCRGGYLGAQAHGRAFWPGDQTVDWSAECGIGCLVPSGISIGLMGVAAWGTDIAGCMDGHYVAPFGGGSSDEELWIRWCQLGAMSPLMREHLGFLVEPVADVWSSPATTDAWRQCARWHISLHPYLWTCAHEASRTGTPIFRGLMLHWPEFHESWTLTNQYMLGPSLLCAPVLAKGERERSVWLPPGEWHDWWTGEVYRGPGRVTVPAPLGRWPVLQRGGSVVPLLKDVPLDLNDPRYATGDFEVVARVAGTASEPFVMFDGRAVTA